MSKILTKADTDRMRHADGFDPPPEDAEPKARRYKDSCGSSYYVAYIGGAAWATFSDGKRTNASEMPYCITRAEAQRNLDAWAEKNGLEEEETQ
jgi:hypothetical protein